jgi:aryl-alcohol dehydrogenase-like predicted oxidoreductase
VTRSEQKSPDDFEAGDFRRGIPRYSNENIPNILKLADGLKQVGAAHGATAGQVALAWLLAQGADVIPIPGTRKIKVRALASVAPSSCAAGRKGLMV